MDSRPTNPASGSTTASRGNGRIKCCCIVFLIIVVAAGIAFFVPTLVQLKTPKLRIDRAMVTSLVVGTQQNPSLQATIMADLVVDNPNLNGYNYGNTTLDFIYEKANVGQASVPGSWVARRSTKKIPLVATLDLNSTAGASLSADLSMGGVVITSSAGMRGSVIGKGRSTSLICQMQIMTATRSIAILECE